MSYEYFIIDDDIIEDLNRGMMRSHRPDSEREESDVTYVWASVVTHTDGRTAMGLDGGGASFHANASIMPLNSVYNKMMQRGDIDMDERDAMMDFLQDSKGTDVNMREFIPPSFTAFTQAQMEADGWFPSEV